MFYARVTVQTPEPGETVNAVNYPVAHPTNAFIAVTGRATGVTSLNACLLLESDLTKSYLGTVLKGGLNWIIGFNTLPQITAPVTYLLVIDPQTDAGRGGRAIAVKFTIAPPRGGFGNIPIQCPTAGSTQFPQFTAWGSTVGGLATSSCTMNLPASTVVQNGTSVSTGTRDTWMYQFNNLPENEGYTFNVGDGTNTGQNANITIASAGAGPPQP
jgi:hypothetical protein